MSVPETQAPSTSFKDRFGGYLLNVLRGERVIVTRHGRPIAALISIEELEELRRAKANG